MPHCRGRNSAPGDGRARGLHLAAVSARLGARVLKRPLNLFTDIAIVVGNRLLPRVIVRLRLRKRLSMGGLRRLIYGLRFSAPQGGGSFSFLVSGSQLRANLLVVLLRRFQRGERLCLSCTVLLPRCFKDTLRVQLFLPVFSLR